MKGVTNWLRGFGTASLISLILAEALVIVAEFDAKKKEEKLKEIYRNKLYGRKQEESETTE